MVQATPTSLIIGQGEIGRGLHEVLKETYGDFVYSRDIEEPEGIPDKYDYLHICIPYSDKFIDIVRAYRQKYQSRILIIHSTVPVGTSKKLGRKTIHSPVRGKHPMLAEGIKVFVKFVGGTYRDDVHEVCEYFINAGIKCLAYDKPETTEMLKIISTTLYGWQIVAAKEVKRLCEEYDLNFEEVYTVPNKTYNDGYAKLGMGHYRKALLKPEDGGIGGHCLQGNATLLHELMGETRFSELLLKEGQRLGENEKPLENRVWLYCEYWGKKRSSEEIAKELGCTSANVLRAMRKLNIKRRSSKWTESEEATLIKLCQTKTWKEIARELDRTYDAVRIRAIKLGLSSIYNPGEETKKLGVKKKISSTLQGISEEEWDGFKESFNALLRKSEKCQKWRLGVFERDKWTCVSCEKTGCELNADHIKPWAKFPELRFDLENGQTLCIECHKEKTKEDRKTYG